jgi:hypothetical protein
MGVRVELWVLAADGISISLVSGRAPLLTARIDADQFIQSEMELLAHEHFPGIRLPVTHSTSWRQAGPAMLTTYMAIAEAPEFVQDRWPGALPLTTELLAEVGKPFPHAPNGAPLPRRIDVLMHGVRHLRFLRDYDSTLRAGLDANWLRHLEPFEPDLARMFEYDDHDYRAA